jgi:hypothetical protein
LTILAEIIKILPVSGPGAGMMCAFSIGGIDGKGKAAFTLGMVQRGCEEFAGFCERETFRASGGQEASPDAWRGRAKGYETGREIPVDQT